MIGAEETDNWSPFEVNFLVSFVVCLRVSNMDVAAAGPWMITEMVMCFPFFSQGKVKKFGAIHHKFESNLLRP